MQYTHRCPMVCRPAAPPHAECHQPADELADTRVPLARGQVSREMVEAILLETEDRHLRGVEQAHVDECGDLPQRELSSRAARVTARRQDRAGLASPQVAAARGGARPVNGVLQRGADRVVVLGRCKDQSVCRCHGAAPSLHWRRRRPAASVQILRVERQLRDVANSELAAMSAHVSAGGTQEAPVGRGGAQRTAHPQHDQAPRAAAPAARRPTVKLRQASRLTRRVAPPRVPRDVCVRGSRPLLAPANPMPSRARDGLSIRREARHRWMRRRHWRVIVGVRQSASRFRVGRRRVRCQRWRVRRRRQWRRWRWEEDGLRRLRDRWRRRGGLDRARTDLSARTMRATKVVLSPTRAHSLHEVRLAVDPTG
eukprot:scaffold13227_cov117-Isochrysis_galbana.AAC.9